MNQASFLKSDACYVNSPPVGLGLLLRTKARSVRNRLVQGWEQSPVKLATTLALMAVIWLGLYLLFLAVFRYFQQTPLEAAVTIPLVFNFFFAALMVMLVVSNTIIAYMSLFSLDEAAYLLASPVPPRTYVALKYLETLLFSSWSLVLLGLPLMMAMASYTREPWYYYPLFVGFFLAFVPIPGAAGIVLAWAMTRVLTHNFRRRLIVTLVAVAGVTGVWILFGLLSHAQQDDLWVHQLLFRVKFVQSSLLPNTWVTRGVEAALQNQHGQAMAYLAVTLSNGLFLSVVAVGLVARRFMPAFDRAISSGSSDRHVATTPTGGVAGRVFFYLPRRMRLIAAKDLRTFLRDPLQWTQLVVLFGLMVLYLANLPRFTGQKPLQGWGILIPFLNFGAISFILATFTSRFVFPLVSLEGHQFWLIGLLPVSTGQLLIAKFAFAMTVSVSLAVSTTLLATVVLQMTWPWALLQTLLTVSVCVGLCGLSVGIGARLPMMGERNAARIANGFGGTVNLIASILCVMVLLTALGYLAFRSQGTAFQGDIDRQTLLVGGTAIIWTVACGIVAMIIGARHLARIET